ncbi:hypothetical protein SAMN05444166_2002 [Singulisphaera sp. GP187]|nr:hypothetical protein SAMN05444166_2002 [Singulisphaera sp. GP187]
MRNRQFRIRSLMAMVVVAALAMASLQTWQKAQGVPKTPGIRIASTVLATRQAQRATTTSTTIDPITLAGMVLATMGFIRLSRRSLRQRIRCRVGP